MKRTAFSIFCVILFAVMLVHPKEVFTGAQSGLLLWFQIVLPTLLPFIIITNLLFATNGLHYITQAVSPFVCPVFCVSVPGSFAVIAGFLCGYPLGAKITADLLKEHYITDQEARYLLSFCNNTSPMFILNFIVWKTLKDKSLMLPTLLILTLSPILMSFLFRKVHKINRSTYTASGQFRTPPRKNSSWGLEVLDNCIMNGFESIVKVGGYIILFSVLLTLLSITGLKNSLAGTLLLSSLEITNGVVLLGASQASWIYPAILALTSFGGFCAVAQTQCMLQGTSLSVIPYTIEKLATALVTSLLALLFLKMPLF